MDRAEQVLRRAGWVCAAAFLVCVLLPLRDGLDGWAEVFANPGGFGAGWGGGNWLSSEDSARVIAAFPLFALPFVVTGCLVHHPVARFVFYTVPVVLLAGVWLYVDISKRMIFAGFGWREESFFFRDLERHALDAGVLLCAIGALGGFPGDGRRRWRVIGAFGILTLLGSLVFIGRDTYDPPSRLVRWATAAACSLFSVAVVGGHRSAAEYGRGILIATGVCLSSGMFWFLRGDYWAIVERETRFSATALLAGLALAWFLLWSWEPEEPEETRTVVEARPMNR